MRLKANPKEGDIRIWHNSRLGDKSTGHFERDAKTIKEAKAWVDLLADYDLWQGDRVVANAQGIMRFERGEWCEIEDCEL